MTVCNADFAGSPKHRGNLLFPVLLAVFVLVTRLLCRGSLYFADGPAHVESIIAKVFVIQPPGYWLFNHIGGLYGDPVVAITVMNISFSVAGVVVFYYTACFFTGRWNAFLAALAYSTVFYIWFSGEVHSTYASQILFPVATFNALLSHERDRAKWMLWLAAGIFAVGAGLRPSDGVFMIPMVLYFAAFRLQRREALTFLSLISVLCLCWVVPTLVALHNFREYGDGIHDSSAYFEYIVTCKSVLTGLNGYTLANSARYVIPLLAAFWPVLGIAVLNAVRNWNDWRVKSMVIWVIPGSLFFLLFLITDPTFLNFLSAAILLLAVGSPRMTAVTALSNSILFLAMAPIPSQKIIVNVADCYVLQYTRYGIQHHSNLRLSEILQELNRK